jgi:hypothetical protein
MRKDILAAGCERPALAVCTERNRFEEEEHETETDWGGD